MKKCILALLCAAAMLFFAGCAAMGDPVLYVDEAHEHVYGFWYDVTPLSCVHAGEQVRYCKVCLREERQTLELAQEIAERHHNIENGHCTLCEYVEN